MAKPNASGAAAESGGAATNDAGNHHPQQHQQLTESFVRAFDKQRSTLAGFARCSNLEELHVVRDGFYLGMAKDLCPDEYKRVLVMVLKRKFGSSNGNGNGNGDETNSHNDNGCYDTGIVPGENQGMLSMSFEEMVLAARVCDNDNEIDTHTDNDNHNHNKSNNTNTNTNTNENDETKDTAAAATTTKPCVGTKRGRPPLAALHGDGSGHLTGGRGPPRGDGGTNSQVDRERIAPPPASLFIAPASGGAARTPDHGGPVLFPSRDTECLRFAKHCQEDPRGMRLPAAEGQAGGTRKSGNRTIHRLQLQIKVQNACGDALASVIQI
mmetsp:Transcript_17187/g.35914  ORF Transcript_17187/g.35914 Transcript_17187/m.35914 type:complete len:325 (+) Transcript_17187:48-1022(+)